MYRTRAAKTSVLCECVTFSGELVFFWDSSPHRILYHRHKLYECVCCVILYASSQMYFLHVCRNTLAHMPNPFPLFCQVGCQNLTRVSTSLFSSEMSCSCSFLREDIQSKVNTWCESSLSNMQLALLKRQPHAAICWVYIQGYAARICSNDILLSQLPVCISSCTPQHQWCRDSSADKQTPALRQSIVLVAFNGKQ